jgi:iron only hydrogenase large subunit-like protein
MTGARQALANELRVHPKSRVVCAKVIETQWRRDIIGWELQDKVDVCTVEDYLAGKHKMNDVTLVLVETYPEVLIYIRHVAPEVLPHVPRTGVRVSFLELLRNHAAVEAFNILILE